MWAIAEETQLKELVREHPEIQNRQFNLVSILFYDYIKWCKFNLIQKLSLLNNPWNKLRRDIFKF